MHLHGHERFDMNNDEYWESYGKIEIKKRQGGNFS
jgi:hypothetical protein